MTGSANISIIGCGKVGVAIAQLAARAGRDITALANRTAARANQLAGAISSPAAACEINHAAGAGDIVLLTVTDDAIEPLCNQLADAGAFRAGSIVAHCSGALGSDILSSAKDQCECRIASMHPLTTFPTAEAAIEKFAGTYCFCEGDSSAVDELMELARSIGGKPMSMSSEGKVLYHAAAVMACNYLTALLDASLTLCQSAGIDKPTAWDALGPLVGATLENISQLGPANALTGPIARGDSQTVARHIEAIGGCDEDLLNFYRIAGKWALQLAKTQDNHNHSGDDDIARLLNSTD
jgi:predicted short-subunit dehydrogenase-like oxidoreductase (DUF2520 family)